ncbi:hypothetical protein [Fusobacterium polymorphum]|uniref:hypothetical protein n=1 Tax=Fusobacterium nucleatum subsp. polymorphum TaxID=76857 RepID=UPI00300A7A86
MAKFRQIQTNFWSNTYIQEEMTAEDKYFYLYLMTNEFTTQIGIYPITKKQMAFDLGYSMESVQALLQRFETYHKLIKYDTETREIILLKWAENNLNIGGKPVQDLIKKEISQVKNKEFLSLMFENCPENSLKNFIASLLQENKKDNNINNSYESLDASLNDTGAINNKEEIINNNNNNINNLKNIIEIQEQKEKVVVNSNGALQQEIKMLLGVRKIKVYDIIKLNKPIERIKFVIDFCNKNNKADGYLFKALKDDWELKEVQQIEKTCNLTKPKEAYKELV